MSKFKSQPKFDYVEAVCFQNDEKSNQEISDLVGNKLADSNVKEVKEDEMSTITLELLLKTEESDEQPQTIVVPFGDFLVKCESGELKSMEAIEFAREYEFVKE